MQIVSEPSDVRMRLPDGRELPATIVLRDQDLDLAFVRPTAKPPAPLVAIDLLIPRDRRFSTMSSCCRGSGRVGGWAPAAVLYSVGAIIEKPRTFFVLNGAAGTGTPAFMAERKTRRAPDDPPDRSRPHEHVRDDGRHRRRRHDAGHPAGGRRRGDRQAGTGGEVIRWPPKKFPVTKTDAEWREILTPEQYMVLRQHATERPGSCALLDEKRAGTFTCAGCGQPLFVATRKFESGTGWPSFFDPIEGPSARPLTAAISWSAPKSTAASAAAISATCSQTVRRRPVSATASTAWR